MKNSGLNLPDDTYIFRITDCTGMFQHAVFSVPDPSEGYTTDDNARALIMAEMLYQDSGDKKYLELAYCYLRFLLYAENDGWFRNFMDYSRNFLEKRGSPDCFGRCIRLHVKRCQSPCAVLPNVCCEGPCPVARDLHFCGQKHMRRLG